MPRQTPSSVEDGVRGSRPAVEPRVAGGATLVEQDAKAVHGQWRLIAQGPRPHDLDGVDSLLFGIQFSVGSPRKQDALVPGCDLNEGRGQVRPKKNGPRGTTRGLSQISAAPTARLR